MGTWFSYMWWGGDPDVVNPVSGLTRREIHAVQKSWAPVNANSFATGSELLRRYDFNTFIYNFTSIPNPENNYVILF